MSSLKTQMSKCNYCYASGTEKDLHRCSRCKAQKYCSRECQRADWKNHKQTCLNNAALATELKEHASTPLGMLERLVLPDGISLYELDLRLEKWVRFHNPTLMAATLHALRLPLSMASVRTYVLHVILEPRSDHGGSAGKYFRVKRAAPVEIALARSWKEPWPSSLDALREMQEDSERLKRGYVTAAMIECLPLAVQTIPFGSIKNLGGMGVLSNWEDILIRDVEKGKKFTHFGAP